MLIILNKSPQSGTFSSILEMAEKVAAGGEKVAFILIQDACIAATVTEYCSKLVDRKMDAYALKTDCEARGLMEKINTVVRLIDCKQWVKLVMDEDKNVISWTS